MAMHRGYYPLSDTQGFRRFGPPRPGATDSRHPMDKGRGRICPAPSRSRRTNGPPGRRRCGRREWRAPGRSKGMSRGWDRSTARSRSPPGADATSFTSTARYTYARSGEEVARSGRSIVYTGYQWRGRSFEGGDDETELREVMMVERGWGEINGRWFAGAYDEFGPDVTLLRADGPVLLGLHPVSLKSGTSGTVTVHGVNMGVGLGVGDVDFGPGVDVVRVVESESHMLSVEVTASEDAVPGARDVFLGGRPVPGQLTVYETIDRIAVAPEWGMARLGGGAFPKGYVQFEAVAYSDGPDGKPETGGRSGTGQRRRHVVDGGILGRF